MRRCRTVRCATRLAAVLLLGGMLIPSVGRAGSLDPAGLPGAGSGMPSLTGIYNQLSTGAAAAAAGTFQEPAAGPTTGVSRTLTEIRGLLPTADNTNGATVSNVLSGKTFWGLRTDGTWGLKSGNITAGANVIGTNGALVISIPDGLYGNSKTATARDTNLVAGNIKSGTTIFGVTGTVIQSTGTAAAGHVLTGVTFSNAGAAGISGAMINRGAVAITPAVGSQAIPGGYHSGAGTVAGDANLVAGNIKSGKSIFGVAGSVIQAGGAALIGNVLSGVTFSNSSGTFTGTMPNNGTWDFTPNAVGAFIPAGYHNGSGYIYGSTNLNAGNIKSGVTIFGVTGSPTVVETSAATASAGEIVLGKTAYVGGSLVTGTRSAYMRPILVNDTGITTWGNASVNNLNAGYNNGQDADHRRGGMLFVKKNWDNSLPDIDSDWNCVLDGFTGLMWEVKSNNGLLHDWNWTYTWYNTDATGNGGSAGTAGGATCGGTISSGCDTAKFVAAVNSATWCSYNDWRMPTVEELRTIVNYGAYNPAISTSWFPNTKPVEYWSSSPDAGDPAFAWILSSLDGYEDTSTKNMAYPVRLVRGGR